MYSKVPLEDLEEFTSEHFCPPNLLVDKRRISNGWNYGPIVLTPAPGKVTKLILLGAIIGKMKPKTGKKISGFTKGKSYLKNLIAFCEKVTCSLSVGWTLSTCISLRFSTEFPTASSWRNWCIVVNLCLSIGLFAFWKHYISILYNTNTSLFHKQQPCRLSLKDQKWGFLAIPSKF